LSLQIHMNFRNGKVYFRRRIPKDLLEHYHPKTEIVFSMRTSDRREGERLCRIESVRLDAEFAAVRARKTTTTLPTISTEEIRQLCALWVAHALEEDENERLLGLDDLAYDKVTETLSFVESGTKRHLARGDISLIEFELIDFCETHGFKISPETEGYTKLAYAFLKASLEAIQAMNRRHQGEVVDTPLTAPITPPVAPIPASEDTFESLRNYWISQGAHSRSAIADAATNIKRLREYFGDIRPSDVTPKHASEFKDKMLASGAAPATINKGRGILAAIFNTAKKNHKIASNPFEGMEKLKVPEREEESPYTIAELQTIFYSPVFKDGYRPVQGKGEAAFWLPLIGLFTGCRLNEGAQLYVEDVRADDGIPYFMIRPDSQTGRTVKDNKKRRVPIHPMLIDMGVMDYVSAVKQSGHIQLFPELKVTRKGGKLGDAWGKWWRSYIRDELGITRIPQPFHGLRHSFSEWGRRTGMDYEHRMRIEGHAMNTVGDKSYGGFLYPIEPLSIALAKLHYKGLDLNHLMRTKDSTDTPSTKEA